MQQLFASRSSSYICLHLRLFIFRNSPYREKRQTLSHTRPSNKHAGRNFAHPTFHLCCLRTTTYLGNPGLLETVIPQPTFSMDSLLSLPTRMAAPTPQVKPPRLQRETASFGQQQLDPRNARNLLRKVFKKKAGTIYLRHRICRPSK